MTKKKEKYEKTWHKYNINKENYICLHTYVQTETPSFILFFLYSFYIHSDNNIEQPNKKAKKMNVFR